MIILGRKRFWEENCLVRYKKYLAVELVIITIELQKKQRQKMLNTHFCFCDQNQNFGFYSENKNTYIFQQYVQYF